MILEGHDLIDKYRRLRILYNRVGLFGKPVFYSDWYEHVFHTNLGDRKVVFTLPYRNTDEQVIDVYYYDGDDTMLFNIKVNRNIYQFNEYNHKISEEDAWLAIYELEELSYKELEKCNE